MIYNYNWAGTAGTELHKKIIFIIDDFFYLKAYSIPIDFSIF